MGTDLRGRSSADAAFALAMAGVTNERLFQSLAVVSQYELNRVGHRSTFESRYVLQIVEKHAAAGTRKLIGLYKVAAECLAIKEKEQNQECIDSLQKATLDLLSPRPLFWLWRFSARQKKVRRGIHQPGSSTDKCTTTRTQSHTTSVVQRPHNLLPPSFQKQKRPLILDLGSGLGTSLLGLANAYSTDDENDAVLLRGLNVTECNFLGVDLSQLNIRFARGISARWGLDHRLSYCCASAEDCLEAVASEYAGQVALVMIQFPTPYRLQNNKNIDLSDSPLKSDGNPHLPPDFNSFMLSDSLLAKTSTLLSRAGGKLLIQSNCEDVAVSIRHRAVSQHGMKIVDVPDSVLGTKDWQPTLRDLEWIRMGGERAVGPGWSSKPLLPLRARAETEVACEIEGKPIHRCVLWMGEGKSNEEVWSTNS
jgi:SAM-dependent methyltransferase